jgi:16S rRNA processing protein RimM
VVVKPHGVRGVVKLLLHDPASRALDRPRTVTLAFAEGERRQVPLQVVGRSKDQLLVQAEGVADRAAAEALRGARVLLERGALEPLEEGQYYYVDLIGCQVVDEAGLEVGKVHQVFRAGASDVLAIRQGATERYLPLVDEWVTAVDLAGRRIAVRGLDQWESWQVNE